MHAAHVHPTDAPSRPSYRWPGPTTLLAIVALALSACGTLAPSGVRPAAPEPVLDPGCRDTLQALDAAVDGAGVADAEAQRIPGVPGLRVDRPAEALLERALADDAAWAAWVARAAELDRLARNAEIRNLLPAAGDADATVARTDACRRSLTAALARPQGDEADRWRALVRVPDRYVTALRAVGLYPLLRWPFFGGVQDWQDSHEAAMARWAAAPPALVRYVPPPVPDADLVAARDAARVSAGAAARVWAGASARVRPGAAAPVWPGASAPMPRDALGLPALTPEQTQALLVRWAPVIEVEQRSDADRLGTPVWQRVGDRWAPGVDTRQPVIHTRTALTRLDGTWLLQLVYTVWFAERPPRFTGDLLAGRLDGVVLRLTLDPMGHPVLADSIHACGCYHLFFPGPSLVPREGAPPHQEWLFAPAPLPALGEGDRLVMQLSTGSHHLMRLSSTRDPGRAPGSSTGTSTGTDIAIRTAAVMPVELRSDDALRSLPFGAGRRSLYGPDGLVAGTERGERFLFWPMGIPSAGAMRQWGHHATAFVGRRHFDEVSLIERRFGWRRDGGPAR
jgi:hypothetical protein